MSDAHSSFLRAVLAIVRAASRGDPYAQAWFDLGTVKIEVPSPQDDLPPLVIGTRDADRLAAEGVLISAEPYQIVVRQEHHKNGEALPNPEVWLLPDGTPIVLRHVGPGDVIRETRALTPGSSTVDEENMSVIHTLLTMWARELRATGRARVARRSRVSFD